MKAPPGRFVVVHRFAFHGFPRSASHRLGQAPGERESRGREKHGDASLVTICSLPFAFSFRSFRSFRGLRTTRGRKETQRRGGSDIFGIGIVPMEKKIGISNSERSHSCVVFILRSSQPDGSLPGTLGIGETIFRRVLFRKIARSSVDR